MTTSHSQVPVSGTGASTIAPGATPGSTSTTHKFSGFTVPAILTWRDPAQTGALFSQAIIAWVVLSSSIVFRLFLRLSVYLLLLLAALEASTRAINGSNNGLIASYRFSRFLPREQAIQNISATVAKNVRSALYAIEYILDTRSPALNAKLAFGAWILYKVLGLFPFRSLALIAIISTFVLPVVYLQFKPQVDEAIGQAQTHLHQQQHKFEKLAHEKAGPQIQFIQKLLNKRDRGGFSTGSHSTPGHSGAHTSDVRSTGVATGGNTYGLGSTGVNTSGLGSTGVNTSGLGSTGVNTSGLGSTGVNTQAGHSGVSSGYSGAHTSGSNGVNFSSLGSTGASTHSASTGVPSSTYPTGLGSTGASTGTAPLSSTTPLNTHTHTGSTTVPHTSSSLHGTNLPTTEEVLSTYDNVPTLAGNVKLDSSRVDQFKTDAQSLRDSIKQDKSFH